MVHNLRWPVVLLLISAAIAQAGAIRARVENGKTVYFNTSSISLPRGVYYSERAQDYADLILEVAGRYGVDPGLVKAVIQAESNFYPYAVSRKGARGLMQLMPGTAARYGVQNIFDPRDNVQGGVHYLRDLLDLFNDDLRLTIAAYNAGENRVQAINDVPNFMETQNYVGRVLALYHGDNSYTPVQANWKPRVVSYYKYVDQKGVTHYLLEPVSMATKVSFTY
jgi:soluble lytic murein transglycosylase-like protein